VATLAKKDEKKIDLHFTAVSTKVLDAFVAKGMSREDAVNRLTALLNAPRTSESDAEVSDSDSLGE
jgi:hypothetical protein